MHGKHSKDWHAAIIDRICRIPRIGSLNLSQLQEEPLLIQCASVNPKVPNTNSKSSRGSLQATVQHQRTHLATFSGGDRRTHLVNFETVCCSMEAGRFGLWKTNHSMALPGFQ
ncbi:hypothetical protein Nepgr_001009 [Nepenthes gracilis]|uniref:Uncharacterized protein n=1 Tax=Nepenthes gracilis TaxID=150966 RepID=A0AAD3P5C3_NEPGR|nr:hypothetical protein Nepgr_001009 [Nepenthes gracilis]